MERKITKKVCNNGNLDCDCNSNPNCHFKQLKRKEQALDEIEEFCIVYSNNHDAYETVYKHILDIINKVKE